MLALMVARIKECTKKSNGEGLLGSEHGHTATKHSLSCALHLTHKAHYKQLSRLNTSSISPAAPEVLQMVPAAARGGL